MCQLYHSLQTINHGFTGLSAGLFCYKDLGIKEAGKRIEGLKEYSIEEVRRHDSIRLVFFCLS